MKLKELRLTEGLVDPNILSTLESAATAGIKDTLHATVLARALMAIQSGYTFAAVNFNAYFDEFFPTLAELNAIKSLPKEKQQQLATWALMVLRAKNVQVASLASFRSIGEIIAYATKAEAND